MPNKKPWQSKEWKEKRKELLGDKCAWCGSTEKLVLHHPDGDYGSHFDDYKFLNDGKVVTLCKRCHFAFHKNYDLCPVCKKFYKQMWFPTCYTCSKQAQPNTACTGIAVGSDKPALAASDNSTVTEAGSPALR